MRAMVRSVALVVAVGLCLAVPAVASAQTLFFDYVGFDYEDPNPNPLVFGEPGSGYVGLGFVPNLFAPLVANTVANEYTYQFSGLSPISSTPVGPFVIIDYSPGTLVIYEDDKTSGTAANYGVNPPNGSAPPSFVDGTTYLVGNLTNFRFILDTSTNTGSFEADYEAVGGAQIGNVPLNQRKGWTFAGATGNDIEIPAGYIHQIDGQTFLNAPVHVVNKTTWGELKARYARGAGR